MTAAWHNPSKVAESAFESYSHVHLESATGLLGIRHTRKPPYFDHVRISRCGIRGLHAKLARSGLECFSERPKRTVFGAVCSPPPNSIHGPCGLLLIHVAYSVGLCS